jgi:hypothetical protein
MTLAGVPVGGGLNLIPVPEAASAKTCKLLTGAEDPLHRKQDFARQLAVAIQCILTQNPHLLVLNLNPLYGGRG